MVGYLLKHKSVVFAPFMEYKTLVENKHGKVIRRLCPDGGGEYM